MAEGAFLVEQRKGRVTPGLEAGAPDPIRVVPGARDVAVEVADPGTGLVLILPRQRLVLDQDLRRLTRRDIAGDAGLPAFALAQLEHSAADTHDARGMLGRASSPACI